MDTFDCAMPTRLARHGIALVPSPETRWRVDLTKAPARESTEAVLDGCPCSTCSHGYTRSYLNYLFRARELTALRLVTIHNLHYVSQLMSLLRDAIGEGRLTEVVGKIRAGKPPWEVQTRDATAEFAMR